MAQDQQADVEELRTQLQRLQKDCVESRSRLREFAEELRKSAALVNDEAVASVYLDALESMDARDMTHPDVATITRMLGLKMIPNADSYWHSILTRRRKKQLGTVPEKYLGLNKQCDEAFAHALGVPTVKTLFRGKFNEVPRGEFPTVIKPVRSSESRGAFYLFEDKMFSIANSRSVANWDELERLGKQQMRVEDLDELDWELQELVTLENEPAPDFKFYCFYGEIGTVLEVARHPVQGYAYFDGDLRPIQFRADERPAFADLSEASIPNGGLSDAKLEIVKRLSLEIPVPFMRIDFLGGDEDIVFCEFSSAPGMSHALTKEHDRRLGEMYHEAEIRLVNDLLQGKTFNAFSESIKQLSNL